MKNQVLMERFKVTEYRDNCIYKTKSEGFYWIDAPIDYKMLPEHIQLVNISTMLLEHLNHRTIRTVSDDTLPMVDVTDLILSLKRERKIR